MANSSCIGKGKYSIGSLKEVFINEMVSFLNADMFDAINQHKYDGAIAIYRYKAKNIFTADENYYIFNSLGVNVGSTIKSQAALSNAETITKGEVSSASAGIDCGCNANGDPNTCTDSWPGGYTYCKKGMGGCRTLSTGCGWFWQNTCNGDCETVIKTIGD